LFRRINFENFDFNYLISVRLTPSKITIPSFVNYTNCETRENSIVNIAIPIYITHKKRSI